MGKIIKFNEEARYELKQGVDEVANAVKVTLGAKGRNVIIDRGFPHVTKDGVTVAKEIAFDEPIKNMGAMLIKETAQRTCDEAGDGTTTSSVLAQAMIEIGLQYIKRGYNPMEMRKGIDIAVKEVVKYIQTESKLVTTGRALVYQVATVAANNDEEIGKLIATAFNKVTEKGNVTVEEAKGFETELKIVDGLRFGQGLYSPYFKNTERGECVLENPYILISDKKIQNLDSLFPIIEKVGEQNRTLLIICDDVDVMTLSTLVLNAQRSVFNCCVVKAPGFGSIKKEWLEDIAIVSGGRNVSDDTADKLKKLELKDLGEAKKIIVTTKDTTIIGGKGSANKIKARIKELETIKKEEKNTFKRNQLDERIAKLVGGIAVISIGGASESEVRERADRIDDAIQATKAAFEEGVVAGGGSVYMRAVKEINKNKSYTGSVEKGMEIVRESLKEPFITILRNAGIPMTRNLLNTSVGSRIGTGYNVMINDFVDMYSCGVIDPAKVLRVALINAASVASMFLTTECSITDKPIENGKI